MGKHKARANGSNAGAAPNRRTGQGAGSALKEMLRRQAQNPRPGSSPVGRDEPPRTGPRKQGD